MKWYKLIPDLLYELMQLLQSGANTVPLTQGIGSLRSNWFFLHPQQKAKFYDSILHGEENFGWTVMKWTCGAQPSYYSLNGGLNGKAGHLSYKDQEFVEYHSLGQEQKTTLRLQQWRSEAANGAEGPSAETRKAEGQYRKFAHMTGVSANHLDLYLTSLKPLNYCWREIKHLRAPYCTDGTTWAEELAPQLSSPRSHSTDWNQQTSAIVPAKLCF